MFVVIVLLLRWGAGPGYALESFLVLRYSGSSLVRFIVVSSVEKENYNYSWVGLYWLNEWMIGGNITSCSIVLPPCCTFRRGRSRWCHLKPERGGGGGWSASDTGSLWESCLSVADCSSFTSEDKHSLTETCRLKWKVGLLCRAAATSRFSPNIQGFLRILNRRQDKERSFRGRIQSNEMRNMILTALLLVHLSTGEALKAL